MLGDNLGINQYCDQDRRMCKHEAYFNSEFKQEPRYVDPGQCLTSNDVNEMLIATPGSGVVVAIYDKDISVGGLAYILLPDSVLQCFPTIEDADQGVIRKAFEPVQQCIQELKQYGAGKNRIRIRLFGASDMPQDIMDRGTKNSIMVRSFLARKGLKIMSEDVYGECLRRIHFFPYTGRAVKRDLRRKSDFERIAEREQIYQKLF